MAYTIVVTEDNTLMTTNKERIMQRSKLVDNLWFLAYPNYKGLDMTDYTVMLEYVLPHSRRYRTETLVLAEEGYKDYLKYQLPVDTKLTTEAGEIEIQLTFAKVELDASGNNVQRVRKISPTTIEIVPVAAWADIIPDSALSALDQRLIKVDAQMRAIDEYMNALDRNSVDDIVYDETTDTIQLSANGMPIGNKLSVGSMLDDGVPVIDIGSGSGEVPPNDGDIEIPELPDEDEDNVVEF